MRGAVTQNGSADTGPSRNTAPPRNKAPASASSINKNGIAELVKSFELGGISESFDNFRYELAVRRAGIVSVNNRRVEQPSVAGVSAMTACLPGIPQNRNETS